MRIHLILALLFLAAASSAHADEAAKRPTVITLFGSDAILGINDNNTVGPSPGDIRTLSLTMSNPKGKALGRADIVQTLTRQIANLGTAVKVAAIQLPKGTITAMGTVNFVDFTDPNGRPNDDTEELAVVGGTGAYIGASGNIDIRVLPGFQSQWVIKLGAR
jgi:hypothetical protein